MTDLFEEKSRDWDRNEIVRGISQAVGAAILRHAEPELSDKVTAHVVRKQRDYPIFLMLALRPEG